MFGLVVVETVRVVSVRGGAKWKKKLNMKHIDVNERTVFRH
jgi:hypothetical protein